MKSQFIEKQVDFGDCRIYYLEGGLASSSAPILFLHGWSVSTEPYQEVLNILSERYQIIAPELPGFNKSTPPEFVRDYDEYAKFLRKFLNYLNIEKVHIVGHSLGGGIAITIAASTPSLVRSLLLVDSTGIPVDSVPKVLFQRAVEMTAQTWQVKFPQINQIFQAFIYNSIFRPQNVIQGLWLSLEKDLRPLLPQIESPCLVLWGANDLTTPLSFGQELAQSIRGAKMKVVEEAYHEGTIFLAEQFTAFILAFIEQVEETGET